MWRPGPEETLDGLVGDWCLYQLRHGNRFTADDLLVAWYAGTAATDVRRVLDLGAGIGSIALMLAWQWPRARIDGIEIQGASAALARRSAAFNGVIDRVWFRDGDVRDGPPSDLRGVCDLVTGNPPFFDPEAGCVSESPQRGPCRFELRGGVEAYVQAAALALAPGGIFVCVTPVASRDRLAGGPLTVVRRRPVCYRADRSAAVDLSILTRGAGPLVEEEPPLALRESDGARTAEFRAIRLAMGYPPRAA